MSRRCPPDEQGHAASEEVSVTSAQHTQSYVPSLTPGGALLLCSVPLGLGTYLGYRRSLHSSSPPSTKAALNGGIFGGKGGILGQMLHPEVSSPSSPNNVPPKPNLAVSGTPPPVLAARALVLGSLLSLSATSLLVSGIFYASGCHSVDDLISTWRSWAPRKMHEMETSLESMSGLPFGKERRSAKREYERAIEGMTEEEEIEYVRNTYGGEIQWDSDDDSSDTKG